MSFGRPSGAYGHGHATLLVTDSPAAQVLDHIKGWKRLYGDDIAVIHVRGDETGAATPAKP